MARNPDTTDALPARSQADIAQRLGLARMTVQRALAGYPGVSVATRNRILAAAREQGYRPNRAALSMRTGRFGTIAVIGATEGGINHLPRQMLRGVHEAAHARGLRVLLGEFLRNDLVDPAAEPLALRQLATDGLLIHYYRAATAAMLARVSSYHLPAVWMNAHHERDCVHPDDHGAGRQAARHLLELGHRRVAYVSHHGERHDSIGARCQGVEDELRKAGLALAERQLDDAYTTADGPAQVVPWLASAKRPTAVICYEQQEAVSVYVAAATLGLRIPDDLSVLAFSASVIRASTGLPISTFIVPFEELGRRAVGLLEGQMEGGHVGAETVALPFEFADFGSSKRVGRSRKENRA